MSSSLNLKERKKKKKRSAVQYKLQEAPRVQRCWCFGYQNPAGGQQQLLKPWGTGSTPRLTHSGQGQEENRWELQENVSNGHRKS